MQGMLVILMLISYVGVEFNTEQFVNCRYKLLTWSRGSKLPILLMGIGYTDSHLMGEEISPLQEDLNPDVLSDSEIVGKPTTMDYVIEGIGGIIGGVSGFLSVAIPLLILTGPEEGEEYGLGGPLIPVGIPSCCIGLPVGSAIGISVTGKIIRQQGSFWKSLLGSYIGLGSGTLLAIITGGNPIGLFLGPPMGAVIGYNWK